jgi:vancomycin resistance protein VanJ
MTYNTLGPHVGTSNVVEIIRAENADVVALQELNPRLAAVLEAELAAEYPYRVLDPKVGVFGMGTLSKHPLRATGHRLPSVWVGTPQVLELAWNGQTVGLVNYHMMIPPIIPQYQGIRVTEAEHLAGYARQAEFHGPVILLGDSNVTHLSDAYKILTAGLTDSWTEAGYGFGHTWGGSAFSPMVALGLPVWLTRIDYVFHSAALRAVDARVARFDGASDHRGVVVRLRVA